MMILLLYLIYEKGGHIEIVNYFTKMVRAGSIHLPGAETLFSKSGDLSAGAPLTAGTE